MPIQTRTIPPTVAFPVTYEGELMAIYHCYEDDDFDKDCEFIYTADIKDLAIQQGLISFDVEGRVTIHEIKEVSNG
jgi:hypothetical protein